MDLFHATNKKHWIQGRLEWTLNSIVSEITPMALTDDEVGFVEMYRRDEKWLARVARCEVKEPGFGMNAVWY
jgi:hypothetical protein